MFCNLKIGPKKFLREESANRSETSHSDQPFTISGSESAKDFNAAIAAQKPGAQQKSGRNRAEKSVRVNSRRKGKVQGASTVGGIRLNIFPSHKIGRELDSIYHVRRSTEREIKGLIRQMDGIGRPGSWDGGEKRVGLAG
jgi:hypothetical protein